MFQLIVKIATLVILYFVYTYLVELQTCNCADQQAVRNIKKVEEFFILVTSIGILCSLMHHLLPKLFNVPAYILKYSFYLVSLYFIFVVAIDIYLIYNVYTFGLKLPIDCLCAQGWEKYYIYLQAITAFFFILFLIYGGFSLMAILPMLASKNNKSLMKMSRKKRGKSKK
jgi:hypothetical protein